MARTVTCKVCGRTFEKAGWYYKSGSRYVCRRCGAQYEYEVKQRKKEERLARTGMKQSYFAFVLKLLFGVLFIATVFTQPMARDEVSVILGLGISLILWGLIPFLRRKRVKAKLQ